MLIIEGTDCVGKTTLAHKLCELSWMQEHGYVYKHFSRLPRGFDYFHGYCENAVQRSVQDRFHMSEVAYALARGDAPNLDGFGYQLVDSWLISQRAACTVLVLCDKTLLAKKFAASEKGEMYNWDVVRKANDYFRIFAEGSLVGFFRPNINLILRLTEDKPWPNEEAVKGIIDKYTAHQHAFTRRTAPQSDLTLGSW